MDDVIFEIPIYLRSSKEYENERLLNENKLKKYWDSEYAMGEKIEVRWPPWEYNDIIGYFKIIMNSSPDAGGNINGIRVEEYFIDSKRILRDPGQRKTKMIFLRDPWFHKKLSAPNIQRCDTKSTLSKIINALSQDLVKVKKKQKRYYIDCKYYQNLIECLDFEKIKVV